MEGFYDRLWSSFVTSLRAKRVRSVRGATAPNSPPLLRRTVYLGGRRIPCGQSVDFAEDGERVDRLWIAAQICEGPSSTGLRLSTLMVYQANRKFRWRRNKTKSENVWWISHGRPVDSLMDNSRASCPQADTQAAHSLPTTDYFDRATGYL